MTSLSQIRKLQDIIDPRIKQRYTKYYNLPESVRQALLNVETANKIKEIADKNNLNDAQLWSISYITGVIMLGEANIVNFLKAIEVECEIDRESARKVARDINSAIFLPIKEDLKKIHKIEEWPREKEGASNGPNLNGNIINLKQ